MHRVLTYAAGHGRDCRSYLLARVEINVSHQPLAALFGWIWQCGNAAVNYNGTYKTEERTHSRIKIDVSSFVARDKTKVLTSAHNGETSNLPGFSHSFLTSIGLPDGEIMRYVIVGANNLRKQ